MSTYVIPEDRKQYLLEEFVEYQAEQLQNNTNEKPDKEKFDLIESPEEIYFLAERLNWDDGSKVPRWIIESPYCTKAAALVVFWTSAPDYYMEYSFEEISENNAQSDEYSIEAILGLLKLLVERFSKNNFHKASIGFDFNYWGCPLKVDNPKWSVGPEFFKSIPGIKVI